MSKYKKKSVSSKFFLSLDKDETVETKKKEIIKCLDEGANINERFSLYYDNTPLHVSVINGDIEILTLLLQRGANINYKNSEGKTAVDIAKELDSDLGSAMVELLERFDTELQIDEDVEQNIATVTSIVNHKDPKLLYDKRAGTSGIKGQLYQSKLLSLVFIRASLNKQFDEFYLGTCLDEIGAFNDVCIRYVQDGIEGVVFLLAKPMSDVKKAKVTLKDLWKADGDFSLHKYYGNYLEIIQKLQTKNETDVFFKLKTTDIKITLAVYITAEMDLKENKLVAVNHLDETVRDLICSGDSTNIYKYKYNEDDIVLLTNTALTRKIACIGESLAYCICTRNYDALFNDYCLKKYHVALAQNVIKVSEITDGGYRIGNFRREFLCSFDSNLVHLKLILFKSLVASVQIDKVKLSELIDNVDKDPTVLPISELMTNVLLIYDHQNNILVIPEECHKDVTYRLFEIKVDLETYAKAFQLAINKTLELISFKLPSTFGNIDIAVDDEENCEKILTYLAEKLIEIVTMTNQDKNSSRITVDDMPFMNFGKVFISAVGNLLILDNTNKCYKLNTNEQSLGKNAKIVLEILKSRIKNLDHIGLRIKYHCFPKLTLDGDDEEKTMARNFFDMLCFYTCQSKEDDLEVLAKDALQEYCIANNHQRNETASDAQYDAVCFIIHDVVQKWWMSDEKSYYLENNREFIDNLLKEFSGRSLLNVISCLFVNRLRKYDIKFNKDAVDCLSSQVGLEATVLITEVSILTGIKLTQCFHNLNSYAFVDLNDITCLSKHDYFTLIQELKSIKLKALIILYEDVTEAKNKIFLRLTEKSVTGNYILVTNELSAEKLKLYITHEMFLTLRDTRNDLKDLDHISQEKVLDKIFMFQGCFVKFSTIMTPESKTLIKAHILQKIINNDIIGIGKTLTNPYYEEIKNYYVQRHLHRIIFTKEESIKSYVSTSVAQNEEKIKINTLEALKDTVVIVGAPGMGKSTFITYLSIETKQINPSIWIERINLLDQTKELYRLQENKIKINKIEALKFICKAILSRNLIRYCIKPTPIVYFDLEINKNEVVLKNCDEVDYLFRFELEIFIHCYNQGNTILLFDGFDEICPHYKEEMTEILKCLVKRYSSDTGFDIKQRMWITSRSYNNIKETLEKEFGVAYNLKMFTNDEQNKFMTRYFKINLNVNELNFEQFKNIDNFFEFMKDFVSHFPKKGGFKFYKLSTTFLQILYFTAMNYFLIEVNRPLPSLKKAFTKKWASIFESREKFFKLYKVYSNLYLFKQYKNEEKIFESSTLNCTPLHIYIVMEYFINQIKTVNDNLDSHVINKWDFEMNTLSFYKYFIEMKLKKIRFEEKNQMDLYNSDIIIIYQRELKDFMHKHKKLAFYATFKDDLNDLLTEKDIVEIRNIIQGMEAGREKTGIIDSILSSGIPKFVHLSFQEYLAVEYMVDLLKSKHCDQLELWSFIICKIRSGFLDFFDRKMEFDNELINIITDIETKEMIFKNLARNIYSKHCSSNSPSILEYALDLGLKQITKLLLRAVVDLVNFNNLNTFIMFVKKTILFKSCIDFGWDDVLCIIFSCIRKVDAARLSVFNPGFLNTTPYSQKSNIEIISDFKWQLKKYKEMIKRKKCLKPRLRYNTI